MILKIALLFLLWGQAPPSVETGKGGKSEPAAVQASEEGTQQKEVQQGESAKQSAPADTTAKPAQQGRPAWITWVILLGVLVVFYLLMILPQRRRQKKHQEMLKALARGDKVVTTGGIVGTIAKVKEDTFVIKTAEKTEIEIDKTVVSQKK